ncbi:hypothetical protein [Xanthomonas sacchari]|uniref:hypothetical protein n=1 Tax=Xanthomonas sacchari TaxID=56458 RepID=UPI0022520DC9|nr:hypothetical protein [Xanthomonas sacchari]MCW0370233.1 hypothetical protein [Xanthomonas sacchari]
MSAVEQRARELLDLHADPIPVAVEGGRWFMVREQDALDAIVAALPQEVSHKAEARDDFPGLLRALTKVARLDEGEHLWIEPSEAKAVIAALASQAQVPEDVRRDAERLDWLEGFVRKAYFYGGSFDFAKSSEGERGGYRFMSRARLGQRHSTIREAIDAAMAVPPTPEEVDRA